MKQKSIIRRNAFSTSVYKTNKSWETLSQLLFLALDNLVVGSAGETIDDKVERCDNGDGNATYDVDQLSIGHSKG